MGPGSGPSAVRWGIIAFVRGEQISAAWLVFAAVASYAIAYLFYSRFIAHRALKVDDTRATPAERVNDGQDYQPTDRRVLFGHGAGVLAGADRPAGPAAVRAVLLRFGPRIDAAWRRDG